MSPAVTERRAYDTVSEAKCRGAAVGVVVGGWEVYVLVVTK